MDAKLFIIILSALNYSYAILRSENETSYAHLAQNEFMSELTELLENKFKSCMGSFYSKNEPDISDIDANQYAFILFLNSVSCNDTLVSDIIARISKQPETDWKSLSVDYLDFSPHFIYVLLENSLYGENIIHFRNLVLNKILNLTDVCSLIREATDKGNTRVLLFLLDHQEGCDLVQELQNAWSAKSWDIVKIFIKNGALKDLNEINISLLSNERNETLLHFAVVYGTSDCIMSLLSLGASVDVVDVEGSSPLMFALNYGKVEAAKLLIDNGADPNTEDLWGDSALHLATAKGYFEIVKVLVGSGSILYKRNKYGLTPLNIAELAVLNALVSRMIHYGVEIPVEESMQSIFFFLYSDRKNSIYNKEVEMETSISITDYLKNSSNFVVSTKFKSMLLKSSIKTGDTRVFQVLIKLGADISFVDDQGETVLCSAVRSGQEESVNFLLDQGADINSANRDGNSPLHVASRLKNLGIIKVLLKREAKINHINDMGRTPLHLAAITGALPVVNLLISSGADKNLKDRVGKFPFDLASEHGHWFLSSILCIKSVTSPHTSEKNSVIIHDISLEKNTLSSSCIKFTKIKATTTIHKEPTYACRVLHDGVIKGNYNIVRLLLDRGCNVNKKNVEDITPLYEASYWGRTRIANLLLDRGADICIRNGVRGLLAIHAAALRGNKSIVELFIKRGIDVSVKSNDGTTALEEAEHRGHTEVTKLLSEESANQKRSR